MSCVYSCIRINGHSLLNTLYNMKRRLGIAVAIRNIFDTNIANCKMSSNLLSEDQKNALIYGGMGAVGNSLIQHFKSENWRVISIAKWKNSDENTQANDTGSACELFLETHASNSSLNQEADVNILIRQDATLSDQEKSLTTALNKCMGAHKLDAIICVAGGFEMGTISDNLIEKFEAMSKENVHPALLTVSMSKFFLNVNGFVCFFGAKAALTSTPHCVAYGGSKAMVHSLAKSLASSKNILPNNVLVVAILPVTIDTFINRQNMPDSDVSAWTPTKYIVQLLYDWAMGSGRPPNGSLIEIVTKDFNTKVNIL